MKSNLTRIILSSTLLLIPFYADAKIYSEARVIGLPEPFYERYIEPLKGQRSMKKNMKESWHTGSYYEIGKSQAAFLLKSSADYKKESLELFQSLIPADHPLWKRDPEIIKSRLREFFPEIIDEIKGFAEVMKIPEADALRIYSTYGYALFGCTIFAAGTSKGADGDVVIGRNFDWHMNLSDLSVTGIRPAGGYASMGSAEAVVGRVDGINEKGLFIGVTVSVSKKGSGEGYFCPIVIRAVLDKAGTVDEAVKILEKVPQTAGWTFLIADRSGSACVAEYSPGSPLSVRYLKDTQDGYIVSTNHYQNPDLKSESGLEIPNSYERLRIVRKKLDAMQTLTTDDAYNILTHEPPHGVYMKSYDFLGGTVYSGAYNLSEGSWKLKTGDNERDYLFSDFMAGRYKDTVKEVTFSSDPPAYSGFVADGDFGVNDLETFYMTMKLSAHSSPIPSALMTVEGRFRFGLFGTDKPAGPNIEAGAYAKVSPYSAEAGLLTAFNPWPAFSLELSPFYKYGWGITAAEGPSSGYADQAWEKYKDEPASAGSASPGLLINPILKFSSFVRFENRFYFMKYSEKVYDPELAFAVEDDIVWSPVVRLAVPYSKHIAWGLQSGGGYLFTGDLWNMHIGPLLMLNKIGGDYSIIFEASRWINISGSEDKYRFGASIWRKI